ncbi:hypothetical protein MTO96_000661 [Rhipicephalus appendiculatus]
MFRVLRDTSARYEERALPRVVSEVSVILGAQKPFPTWEPFPWNERPEASLERTQRAAVTACLGSLDRQAVRSRRCRRPPESSTEADGVNQP